MANDLFGYKRDTQAKEILSTDYAVLSVGDEKAKLVQSVRASYSHRVEPRYEAGSSSLYWVNGQPTGSVAISRVIGSKGWLSQFIDNNAACAFLSPLSVSLDGEGHCELSTENKTLKMEDSILASVDFSFSAGQLDIQESVNIMVAKMTVSDN
jgi:hypothetical protein